MIEFIIPTYNRPNALTTMIGCILQQTYSNWKLSIVADGEYEGYDRIKDYFSKDNRIHFTTINGPNNDWGHTAREYGLQHATEEWVVMSGDDNYYVPYFVEHFTNAINCFQNANFIFCDMLHNHNTISTPSYRYFDSKPEADYIDIGNFCTKTANAKTIKFNKGYAADADYVNDYLTKYVTNNDSITKINKALYIHN